MRRPSPRDPFAAYLLTFLAVGLAVSFLGPALTHLQATVHASYGAIAILFSAQALGYLIGSLVAAPGVDRQHGHLVLVGSLLTMAVGVAVVPALSTLPLLVAAFVLIGAGAGSIDVAANTLLVWSRRHAVGPYMNALHLAFGVGALAAPLLVGVALTSGDSLSLPCAATVAVSAGAAAWVLTRRAPRSPHQQGQQDLTAGGFEIPTPDSEVTAPPGRSVAVIAGFFLLYVGLEVGAAGWLFAYAEAKGLGETGFAAVLTTSFWAAFTAGRLLSIGLVRILTPTHLLVGSAALGVVAAATMTVTGGSAGLTLAAVITLGLALAPQYPTMMTIAGRHLHLTGRSTAWFIGASAIGGLVLPWLIGQLFGSLGAGAMPAAVLVAGVVTLAWIGVILRVLGTVPLLEPVEEPSVGSALL
jgi:fucose permease